MVQGFVLDVLVQNLWEVCSQRLLPSNHNMHFLLCLCELVHPYFHFINEHENSRTQNTEHLRMSNKFSISISL